jgi:hypothetical protein
MALCPDGAKRLRVDVSSELLLGSGIPMSPARPHPASLRAGEQARSPKQCQGRILFPAEMMNLQSNRIYCDGSNRDFDDR